ncbi:hypothetical protein A2Z33_05955 [Candidatus Gottesmanbacteria bacterium RBG_16_52_11]|uniref:Fido domain-containing protein n=1 Tax=Candidatus Gottesmanbacteria bacterium RBG_16_52_11 TaxID=1798374 RepID=A0A1F5YXG5_9BACT|nr:MAG: hypothetical protein A2Z33_05955 [Candidatus Gottesmanbacteria bacterium RBG_16_52_11]
MKFPPIYSLTPQINSLLYEIDVLKAAYSLHPVPTEREILLRRKTLLKSSLYSARIEGNNLNTDDLDNLDLTSEDREKTEIANLVSAYEKLPGLTVGALSEDTITLLHRIVLTGISPDAGHLRTDESAIYNQSGTAAYLTPAPRTIPFYLTGLYDYVNRSTDPIPVVTGTAHIWIEKIHPFSDGNGRVGRLLSALILMKGGYDFGGLVPLEEYLDAHRDAYYFKLGRDRQDVTEFIGFFLNALLEQARISLKLAREPEKADPYAHLLPRRGEIMRIIRDHRMVSFDFLSRRFRAVPQRTLHYDLAQLVKSGLIRKMGSTRGVQYGVAE